ncbi:hypothetical protein NHH03_21690 [Stieleria sp. TO1_6]|uniref:hypothetical protein n=1 Tax=Stieleria tagensis TaxID=2956795 RepID=UPI00209AFD7A|nr:hypothetical protein [Stieleria tagensis]MCO8124367.1 hypothetical protein [Stieleria tagensis]
MKMEIHHPGTENRMMGRADHRLPVMAAGSVSADEVSNLAGLTGANNPRFAPPSEKQIIAAPWLHRDGRKPSFCLAETPLQRQSNFF